MVGSRPIQMSDMSAFRRPTLVYIVSASHSGSTLLAMLLNSHADICSVGEMKISNLGDSEYYRCSCQKMIRECRFWKSIKTEMESRGFDFDVSNAGTDLQQISSEYVKRLLRPLHRSTGLEYFRDLLLCVSPVWRKSYPLWQQQNLAFAESVLETSGNKVIVDSSKTGIRLKYLLKISGLDVRVIRLIRDGRAVALTYMDSWKFADAREPSLRGGGNATVSHQQKSMEQAAIEWRRSNEEAESILSSLGDDQSIQIRYEDLCQNTAATLGAVTDFLGLDTGSDYASFRSAPHHVIGNGMRLDNTSEVRLDDRWRKFLSQAELGVFERIAGEHNRRYGYA